MPNRSGFDTFLLLCLLAHSRLCRVPGQLKRNRLAWPSGREPGLQLETDTGLVALADWARQLLEACDPIVGALDRATRVARATDPLSEGPTDTYGACKRKRKNQRPAMTPSAKVIAAMAMHGSFQVHYAPSTRDSAAFAGHPVTQAAIAALQKESADSLRRQAEVEVIDIQTSRNFWKTSCAPLVSEQG